MIRHSALFHQTDPRADIYGFIISHFYCNSIFRAGSSIFLFCSRSKKNSLVSIGSKFGTALLPFPRATARRRRIYGKEEEEEKEQEEERENLFDRRPSGLATKRFKCAQQRRVHF